ncbi:MAG: hypothetical protein GXY83_19290 [Rhodopirellula sp.]|nr:hypothetical protein [Rhodopirellula sp.]
MRTTAKHSRQWKCPKPMRNSRAAWFFAILAVGLSALGACGQRENTPSETTVPSQPAASGAAKPAATVPPPSQDEVSIPTPPPDAMPTVPDQPEKPAAEPPLEQKNYDPQKAVPLVENPQQLQRLHPSHPVWFDKQQRCVVIAGQVCAREVPLELFACLRGTKEHEAIVAVDTPAHIVHAGLMAAGATPGNPVQFYPEYVPATGPEIEITVVWEDPKGSRRTARAQDWVRNTETKQPMQDAWIFAGSQFTKDERTNEEYYQADGGDFICVSNFPSAMLDIPIKSSDSNAALMFEGYAERIPPLGTPVTLILKPKADPTRSYSPDNAGGSRPPK